MVQKYESEPFCLTKKSKKLEFFSKDKVRILKIVIDQGTGAALLRGQRKAECLVAVRDERGEIIACRSTAKWLVEHIDKLEELPVNAWLNDNCDRVHPNSPPPIKLGYMPDTY